MTRDETLTAEEVEGKYRLKQEAEELEKEAEEYGKKATAWLEDREPLDQRDIENAYLAGAEPREKQIVELEGQVARAFEVLESKRKQIQIDAEQIRALQKQNGELNDRVKKLEAQIEEMKCCYNCKHSRTEYEHCKTNKHEKWEIKEK